MEVNKDLSYISYTKSFVRMQYNIQDTTGKIHTGGKDKRMLRPGTGTKQQQ